MGWFMVIQLMVIALFQHVDGINLSPTFTYDMNGLDVYENTPIDSVIYRIRGEDPDGSKVYFRIEGTTKFEVDEFTGEVRVTDVIEREGGDEITEAIMLIVVISDVPFSDTKRSGNVVRKPISVRVVDVNDNKPQFEEDMVTHISVREDTDESTIIYDNIKATDIDETGEILSVECIPTSSGKSRVDACSYFSVQSISSVTTQSSYTGGIRTRKKLNYDEQDSFELNLRLSDGINEVRSRIFIEVIDVQNKPPFFISAMNAAVDEDSEVGKVVMKVEAKDGDQGRVARKITYKWRDGNDDDILKYFRLDPRSGVIYVEQKIDDLKRSSVELKVRALEQSGVDDSDTFTDGVVSIIIKDVNDHAPIFNKDTYTVDLREDIMFGTDILQEDMIVEDMDVGRDSMFKLGIVGDSNVFKVEPAGIVSGRVRVRLSVNSNSFDYEDETKRVFNLKITATETNSTELKSATSDIIVYVKDVNDNFPTFERETYIIEFDESIASGTEISQITASDADSNDYGARGIRYSMIETNDSDRFTVDAISGKIYISQCLHQKCFDFETKNSYELLYAATDNNGEGKIAYVNIRAKVMDVNDNPPQMLSHLYKSEIHEDRLTFEPPLVIKAIDNDISSDITFSILSGNEDMLFQLDPKTGMFSVNDSSEVESRHLNSNHTLTVQVSDGEYTDMCNVLIWISDTNNNGPIFNNNTYKAIVPENIEVGTEILRISATDEDKADNSVIIYSIVEGDFGDFNIDNKNGTIKVVRNLDPSNRNIYYLNVSASDDGDKYSRKSYTIVTMNITAIPSNIPRFIPITQSVEVAEDASIGTIVYRLEATIGGADDQPDLEYDFEGPVTAIDAHGKQISNMNLPFGVEQKSGIVFVNSELNRRHLSTVSITTRVRKVNQTEFSNGKLMINLVDVNDHAPVITQSTQTNNRLPGIEIEIPENLMQGTVVYTIEATDFDSSIDHFESSISSTEGLMKHLQIDGNSGEITIIKPFDYEHMDAKTFNFTVTVYDTGIPRKSSSVDIKVNILNVNDESPTFSRDVYNVIIEENTSAQNIIQLEAIDRDAFPFGDVEYIFSSPMYAQYFNIDKTTGWFSIINPEILDREKKHYLSIPVISFDKEDSEKFAQSTINVTIVDANDHQPHFIIKSYETSIMDNSDVDGGNPSIALVQLLADDSDIGDNGKLLYHLVERSEHFKLEEETGVLYPIKSFMGFAGKTFTLHAIVSDVEGNKSDRWKELDVAQIDVQVTHVNTHRPHWVEPKERNDVIRIQEEMEFDNFVVAKVRAIDEDGDEVSYYIKQNNENVNTIENFKIDARTGEIFVTESLDREVQSSYELIIVANDNGSPIAFERLLNLKIQVTDINDNEPEFRYSPRKFIHFALEEELQPDSYVGQVEAFDPDVGEFGKIHYFLIEQDKMFEYFRIDKTQGKLYTNRRIDRESKSRFKFHVLASNEKSFDAVTYDEAKFQGHRNVVEIVIEIKDINDNMPKFTRDKYSVGIPFNAHVGYLISEPLAYDLDNVGDGNSRLKYYLKSSYLYKYKETKSSGSLVPSPFTINSKTGQIHLNSLIREFNQDKFVLTVEAVDSDHGNRAKTVVVISVYEPQQTITLTMKKITNVTKKIEDILENQAVYGEDTSVYLDDIKVQNDNKENNTSNNSETSTMKVIFHLVDDATNTIMNPERVLETLDLNYDVLKNEYSEMGIVGDITFAMPLIQERSTHLEGRQGMFFDFSWFSAIDMNVFVIFSIIVIVSLFMLILLLTLHYNNNTVNKNRERLLDDFYDGGNNKSALYDLNGMDSIENSLTYPMSSLAPPPKYSSQLNLANASNSVATFSPVMFNNDVVSNNVNVDNSLLTPNPLWLENQEMVSYEEQELTMNVNGVGTTRSSSTDNNQNGSVMGNPHKIGNGKSSDRFPFGTANSIHAYATISKMPKLLMMPHPSATSNGATTYSSMNSYSGTKSSSAKRMSIFNSSLLGLASGTTTDDHYSSLERSTNDTLDENEDGGAYNRRKQNDGFLQKYQTQSNVNLITK